jgi:hypothetical protein
MGHPRVSSSISPREDHHNNRRRITVNVIKEFDKNQAFYTRILTEDDFRGKIIDLLAFEVYRAFNNAEF